MKTVLTALSLSSLLVLHTNLSGQVISCAQEAITFSSNTSAEQYQWQVQEVSQWTNILNGGSYTGSQSNVLSVNPVLESMDGNNYRCLIPSVLTGAVDSVVFLTSLTVLPELVASQIEFESSPETPLCNGTNSITLIQSALPSGANGVFSVAWEMFNGVIWSEVIGADPNSLTVLNLTQTRSYRQRIEGAGVCGPVYSNELVVEVYAPFSPGTISIQSNDAAICYNSSPGVLLLNSSPTGGSGSYTYQWQNWNGAQWVNIAGQLTPSYTPPALTQDQQYRLQVSDAECGGATTNELAIEVFEPLSPSFTIADITLTPLCDSNTGTDLFPLTLPQGGGEVFSFQWYENGVIIPGETSQELNTGFLENTASFQLVANSLEGCGSINSNSIVVSVYEPLAIGTSNQNQTICYATSPAPIVNNGASGGSGAYQFQWQANSGFGWNNVIGAQELTLNPGLLTTTSQFRLNVTDQLGCGVLSSNAVLITVLDPLESAIAAADNLTICYGAPFSVSAQAATGADGDFTNMWYIQINNGGFVANPGLTDLSWEITSAVDDYDFYLESSSNFGCGTVTSDVVSVDVLEQITQPTITTPGYNGENLCFGDLSIDFETATPASGADGEWSYAWQVASTANDWENVQPGFESFNTGVLFDTVQVRLESVSEFGCGTFYSNTVLIPVWEELQPGVIGPGPEQIICFNTAASTLVSQPPTGGGDVYSYQWYAVVDGEADLINGATNLLFNTGALVDTSSYYLQYTSSAGCGIVFSNSVQVSVLPELENPVLDGWSGNAMCYNDELTLLGGSIIDYPWLNYQWYAANDDELFDALTSFNEIVLDDLVLQETTSLFLEVTSAYGCGVVYSDTLMVDVLLPLETGMVAFEVGFDESTQCNGVDAPEIQITQLATGGGGPLVYEWEFDQGSTGVFVGSGENNESFYAFGTLTDTTSIRLRVTDEYGCGTLVSNALVINVYAPLEFDSQPETQLVCFGALPSDFSAIGSGAGDLLTYQWYASTDGEFFTPILSATNNVLSGDGLEVSTLFFLEVTSSLGCGQIQSDTVAIQVLEELVPGQVVFEQNPICAEETVIVTSSLPNGGFNDFNYSWYRLVNGEWVVVQEEGDSHTTEVLLEDEVYYISYDDACGTVFSDPATIIVNPLPTISSIVGPETPCYSSTNQSYQIPNASSNYEYSWNIDPLYGEITSGETSDEVLVNWSSQIGETTLEVLVTNPETACNKYFYYLVDVLDVMAPPPSLVVKKPGINILVSADSTDCAQYVWGKQNIESGEITYFNDLTEQYAFFQGLDTLNYYYFVDVRYDCGDGESCPTTNYYNYNPFVNILELPFMDVQVYPNPSSGVIFLEASFEFKLAVFDVFGQQLLPEGYNREQATHFLDLSAFADGIYLIRFDSDSGSKLIRRIIINH